MSDIKLRTRLRLTFGLFFNFFYAVFKLFTGILFHSEWLVSIGAYYFIICTSKFMLLRSAKEVHEDSIIQRRRELVNCRYVGLLLFVLSSVISGMAAKMIYDNETVGYPPYFFGLIAVYTAYRLISAIYSLIKYRHADNPFYSTTKSLDLSSALMALLTLQTALLARYGTNASLTRGLNSLTSAVVLITVIAISINIIIKSTKKIKKLVKE
jgi:divalent metal cation (Fe/Co/Zn/Cd) transporter